MGGLLPGSMSFTPPEVKKSGWSAFKDPVSAVDGYPLGLLLHSVFNPTHPPLETAEPPHPPPQPSSRDSIPPSMFPSFKRLLNSNPKGRMTLKTFLDGGMVETAGDESGSSFPPEFASFRILPSLVTALRYRGASAVTIVPLILQFGKNVSPEEYMNIIFAPLTRLFASPKIEVLLDNLAKRVDRLGKKGVVEKIWPNLVCVILLLFLAVLS
ncbi:hypothetical protein JVU11DRAFT_9093 [Chiua virens]|nr:hypothetical protein JVU11DRAFT_9093 [Chiua virens]